jgi:mannose-1-phosphate guanylyltransferase
MKLVILAGGSGTRLWPVSRKAAPKQTKPIIGKQSLIAKTYERLCSGFPKKDIFIGTGGEHIDLIKKDLKDFPSSNYIIEPMRRDTAAAIGLAAIYASQKNPKEILININSDHFVEKEKEYIRIIKLAEKIIRKKPDSGVLIGVKPTYPETGYGYIKMGEQAFEVNSDKIFKIEKFEEKPDQETAEKYMEGWEYLWNLGCFVFRVDTLLKLYQKYLPHMYRHLMKIKKAIGTLEEEEVLKSEFSKIEPISMDYGIIERATDLYVIPSDFGWADVGNWGTVKDILSQNGKKNIKKGKIVSVHSENNLLYNFTDKLVAVIGIKNMVFIETEDAVLLCPKNRAQDIKKIIDKIKNKKSLSKFL